jgi:hypothetical protein
MFKTLSRITSWKTMATGIVAILSAVTAAAQLLLDNDPKTNPDITLTVSAIAAGLGLIFARDNNVTSEQVLKAKTGNTETITKPPTP